MQPEHPDDKEREFTITLMDRGTHYHAKVVDDLTSADVFDGEAPTQRDIVHRVNMAIEQFQDCVAEHGESIAVAVWGAKGLSDA
ncbi:hypothetical protein [Ruegeria sp. HKCCA5491]|uniref:hypothetical protein n=1 Tax=Ruegeria sp. HKCCA5491 TaxID=2682986 RepID=UPI001489D1C2|nr:hypothetical protein [Ruegeria sp. HKCCA5491]